MKRNNHFRYALLTLGALSSMMLWYSFFFLVPDPKALVAAYHSDNAQAVHAFYDDVQHTVTYDELPPLLVQAFVVTEDQHFFEHHGVDISALLRALHTLISTGKKKEGGSTITMQVARNFFLHHRKTFIRKYKEILLAVKIDFYLDKRAIIELYLNKIYFGNQTYGVTDASHFYFNRELHELTISQIALLAGLPRAPSYDNPIYSPKRALARRNFVLRTMFEHQIIDQDTLYTALKAPLS